MSGLAKWNSLGALIDPVLDFIPVIYSSMFRERLHRSEYMIFMFRTG